MPIYLCDRCRRPRLTRPRVNVELKKKLVEDVGWVKLCSPTGYVITLDLCETCMKELAIFLKGDQANGRSEE